MKIKMMVYPFKMFKEKNEVHLANKYFAFFLYKYCKDVFLNNQAPIKKNNYAYIMLSIQGLF